MPAVSERVAAIYGVQAGRRCPGETACEIFQGAAEPQEHVCIGCDLLPTKPLKIEPLTTDEQCAVSETVNQIASLAQHQQAGFVLGLRDVTPLEFELLKIWHAEAVAIERANQAQMMTLLAAGMGLR